MELLCCRNRINLLMSRFVREVQGSAAMGQFDMHSVSETFLVSLLKQVYGLDALRNLNTDEHVNYPAIDLGDEQAKVAFQVTADPSSDKIKKTLRRFVDHKLYESYDHLRFYILTEKQQSYSGKGFNEIVAGKFSFDPAKDVLDYRDILSRISSFQLDKLKPIIELLEDNFGEKAVLFADTKAAIQSFLDDDTGALSVEIARTQMMDDVEKFALSGSGVVVGLPGTGKSHSLRKLARKLQLSSRPCVYVPIDRLALGSEDGMRTDAGIRLGIVEYLSRVACGDHSPGILLLDAFDAARSEQARGIMLGLIQHVQREFSDKWHVIASMRTYDGQRSQRLQDLFPPRTDAAPMDIFQASGVRCRHFAIPELTNDEVEDTVRKIPHLSDVYAAGTPDFRALLKVPFNIWLLQQMFIHNEDIPGLSGVASAVQLLDLFWHYRVLNEPCGEGKRVLLARVADAMVHQNALSVRRDPVFDFNAEEQWNLLFSANILRYTSATEQRVAFSHNILFDYAVSVLLIEDDPARLIEFLSDDATRPLFLRPSLVLYLARLWHQNPDLYWRTLWHVMAQTEDVHLRLFARLLPPVVTVSEARDTEEFSPLLEAMRAGDASAFQVMLRILQAMISSETKRDALWSAFLADASDCLTRDIAGSFAMLATEIVDRADKGDVHDISATCGLVARNLGQWFWHEVDNQKDEWLINLGANWILPLVARTFDTDPRGSRGILERAIDVIGQDGFPINLVRAVVGGLERIHPHDPEFAGEVYLKVFRHSETSQEKVLWGGRVMGFTSTRRQDYEMCEYQLAELFPTFLRQCPIIATRTLVGCVDLYVAREHIRPYAEEGAQIERFTQSFELRGKKVTYIEDSSCIWDSTGHPDDAVRMTEAFCTFVLELAQEPTQQSLLQDLVSVLRDNLCVAFLWRRLLSTAAQAPRAFTDLLFDLCVARPLQLGNDTVHELGEFLAAAAKEFTPKQLSIIEASILAIPLEPAEDDRLLINRRNRLLASIPRDLVSTDEAKLIWEEMESTDNVPPNEPLFRTGSCPGGPYTEEMWLKDQGVNVETPVNQHLLSLSKPLRDFQAKWLNEVPTVQVVNESIAHARQAYEIVQHSAEADESVVESLLTKLAEYAEIVSRAADVLEDDQFQFCRSVLLSCAAHGSPKPDPKHDTEFDHPAWSQARIAAARGLVWLAAHHPDEEMLDLMETLSSDPVPSVRFYALTEIWRLHQRSAEFFWRVMLQRAAAEARPAILQVLLVSLRFVISADEIRSVQVLTTLVARLLPTNQQDEVIDDSDTTQVLCDVMPLLVWLAADRANKWAHSVIDRVLAEPIRFAAPIDSLVSDGLRRIVDAEDDAPAQPIVSFVTGAVDAAVAGVNELQRIPNEQWDEKWTKEIKGIYDIIHNTVSHIYLPLRDRDLSIKPSKPPLPLDTRRMLYQRTKPIIEHVLCVSENGLPAGIPAHTAHYLIELLNSTLVFEPAPILHMAARVVRSSKGSGYHLDSMAIREVVKLVEVVLADHLHVLREAQPLSDVLDVLDVFSEAGWPEAQKLVWRLDEVFR